MVSFGPLVSVFLLFVFFISPNHLTGINEILKLRRGLWEAMTRHTDPNNVKHIVWAIGDVFFLLIVFFVYTNHLTHFYRYYRYY